MCTFMFIAAILMTAKGRKQSKYPLVDEWINKMYTYSETLFTFKKRTFWTYAITWMTLDIMLNEISRHKMTFCLTSMI